MEQYLRWLALAATLLGIPLLAFFLSSGIEAPATDLIAHGTITHVEQHGITTILTLTPTPQLPIVLFKQEAPHVGKRVVVKGRVSKYKGKPEIIATKIEEIEP